MTCPKSTVFNELYDHRYINCTLPPVYTRIAMVHFAHRLTTLLPVGRTPLWISWNRQTHNAIYFLFYRLITRILSSVSKITGCLLLCSMADAHSSSLSNLRLRYVYPSKATTQFLIISGSALLRPLCPYVSGLFGPAAGYVIPLPKILRRVIVSPLESQRLPIWLRRERFSSGCGSRRSTALHGVDWC